MTPDEPCMCGTDFTCMADEHDHWVERTQKRLDELAQDLEQRMWRIK